MLALGSYVTTPRAVHDGNHFSFRPMASVAVVFFGIFVTMTAPLLLLNAHGDQLGITAPWPVLLGHRWALGRARQRADLPELHRRGREPGGYRTRRTRGTWPRCVEAPGGAALLAAISCGAVLMGCLTYIGNGPNLMVKEIAEHRGIRMPNFLTYMAIALLIMVPMFVGVTLLFFATT